MKMRNFATDVFKIPILGWSCSKCHYLYWINELAMKWPATPDLKMNFRGPESYLDHFLSKMSVSSQIAFPCGHYCIKYTSQMCFDSQANQI